MLAEPTPISTRSSLSPNTNVYDAVRAFVINVDEANSRAVEPSPTIILSAVESHAILPSVVDVVVDSVNIGDVTVGVAPNEVRLEEVTPEPSVVALNTVVPFISYTLPVSRLKSSDDVHADVRLTQLSVLSVLPLSVIPPPSAVTFVGVVTEPSSIFLSSTLIVVELIVVVVPSTVRLPLMLTVAPVVPLPRLIVAVLAPIVNVVAAPAKLTVVAVVLIKSKEALPVVKLVVIAGEVIA